MISNLTIMIWLNLGMAIVGLLVVAIANRGRIHRLLRKLQLFTKKARVSG